MNKVRENCFDFLRFLFAFTVFVQHSYHLSFQPKLHWAIYFLDTGIAVTGFFVISGFLVFMSYEKSRSVGDYLEKRARRILPAYIVCVIICAVAGAFLSRLSYNEYFSWGFVKYLGANLVFANFIAPKLPGVFEQNAVTVVNGALWTIKVELMFYLIVPVVSSAMKKLGSVPVFIVLYVCSFAYKEVLEHLALTQGVAWYRTLAMQMPGFLTFFLTGGLVYQYFKFFETHRWWWLSGACVALAGGLFVPFLKVFYPLGFGLAVTFIGFFWPLWRSFGKLGDFSYAMYIYHFPILQTLVALHIDNVNAYMYFLVAMGLVLSISALSWCVVERPFLRSSSHYIQASRYRSMGGSREQDKVTVLPLSVVNE